MAGTRKLSRTTSHRNATLNNLVTSLILNGKVETTKDNYEEKEKTISRAKLDKNGKKVKETKTSKNGNKYEVVVREVVKEKIKVDKPSKLAARRKMFETVNKVKDFNGKTVDLTEKLFNEIAPKYEAKGGYTRIVKLVSRKGDGAEMAIIELI